MVYLNLSAYYGASFVRCESSSCYIRSISIRWDYDSRASGLTDLIQIDRVGLQIEGEFHESSEVLSLEF
jgi:hypothetical protein